MRYSKTKKMDLIKLFFIGVLLFNQQILLGAQNQQASIYQIDDKLQLPNEDKASVVFDQIMKVHNINLIYDASSVKGIVLNRDNIYGKNVDKDLDRVLKGSGLNFKKISESIYVIKSNSVRSENTVQKAKKSKTVLGKVTDYETGEALIGVSILKKGTNNGTQTDFNGNFELKLDKGDVLIFSYIGYQTKEIEYSDQENLNITIAKDEEVIDEVVIIGYGTQKKRDLTGAVSQIGATELKQLPNTGLEQALQGRSAGVFVTQNSGAPGGALSIRIRGTGSTTSAEPLYVIDGIPVINDNAGTSATFERDGGGQYTNALTTINPNDIESIEILKDASATAIYGSRGGNGVVLITTKKGKSGKSSLSYETYVGAQQLYRQIPMMDLVQYAEYLAETQGQDDIEEFENLDLLGTGTNWQDEIFRTAFMQNHQISLSGGSETTTFSLTGGYHEKEGIVQGSKFSRYSMKMNLNHNYSDRLRIGANILAARTKENITFNDNSNGIIYTALLTPPNVPARTLTGEFGTPTGDVVLQFTNPLANALETEDINRKNRVLANTFLEFDVFSGFKYRMELGTDILYSNHNTFWPEFDRNNLSQNSKVRRNLSNNFFWINKHLFMYNKQFNENHKLDGLVGFEAQSGAYEWLFASRENLPTNELMQLNLGDAGTQVNGGGAGDWSLLSGLARLNYSIFDRYLVTGTYRIDGSSRFGPENRYGVFPSFALGWRVSEENFLSGWDKLDNLKVRAGYGTVGNQEIGLYSFRSVLRAQTIAFGDALTTVYGPDNIANPTVKWETSIQTNLGFDLGFYKNRLEVIFDIYNKVSKDMLLQQIIPATAGGFNPPFVNIGEMRNRGMEITLNTQNFIKPIDWRTSFNFSINRNRVLNLGTNGSIPGVIQRVPLTRTVEGEPIGQFYGHVTDGVFTSLEEIAEAPFQETGTRPGDIRFKDLNGDNVIDDADRTFIGNPNPDWTANLINDVAWKNFDLNIFIRGVYGNELYNLIRRDLEGTGAWHNQSSRVVDRWSPLNPEGQLPRAEGNDPNQNRRVSDRFIEDGSYLRLQNLTLGYNLPENVTKRIQINNIRAYVSGQNLFTLTNYSGYDPELGSFNQNPLLSGIDNGRFPISRSITVGLNVGF